MIGSGQYLAGPYLTLQQGEDQKFSKGALHWTAPEGLPPPLDSNARREVRLIEARARGALYANELLGESSRLAFPSFEQIRSGESIPTGDITTVGNHSGLFASSSSPTAGVLRGTLTSGLSSPTAGVLRGTLTSGLRSRPLKEGPRPKKRGTRP